MGIYRIIFNFVHLSTLLYISVLLYSVPIVYFLCFCLSVVMIVCCQLNSLVPFVCSPVFVTFVCLFLFLLSAGCFMYPLLFVCCIFHVPVAFCLLVVSCTCCILSAGVFMHPLPFAFSLFHVSVAKSSVAFFIYPLHFACCPFTRLSGTFCVVTFVCCLCL